METQKDFKELLALFAANKVDYLIVGAHALAYYGAPRYTGDIDLFVRPDRDNAKRVLRALHDFGFDAVDLSVEDFSLPDQVVQLGVPPVRIDILTSITGVTWDAAAASRVEGRYGDLAVYYLGKGEFVLNKRATGRKKDLADLEAIGDPLADKGE
ncbi:MAG: hypothetical protein AAB317_03635 [Nitrospirota bacterium]